MTMTDTRAPHEARRIVDALNSETMLITGEGKELLIEIASRQNVVTEEIIDRIAVRHEAVAARKAAKMDGAIAAQKRGTVAIIDVTGPIMRYADIFSEVSGGVSIETLQLDFASAMSDPGVTAILFHLDSPGGQVKGVNEFANAVRDARGKKPIGGYIESAGSAAYWIGSAVDPGWLWIDALGFAGSIGALVSMSKQRATNSVQVVSGISPKKTIDPESESGLAVMTKRADDIAAVFVRSVAGNRRLTAEEVTKAEGLMLMGEEAVAAGLADKVGSFEELLAAMKPGAAKPAMPTKPAPMGATTAKEPEMSSITATPVPVEEKRSLWARVGVALGLSDEPPTAQAPPSIVAPQPPPAASAPDPRVEAVLAENQRLNDRLKSIEADRQKDRQSAAETCADALLSANDRKFGKEAASPFRTRYVAAKLTGDDAAVADLEAFVKALPDVGSTARADNSGPTADELIAKVTPSSDETIGPMAVANLRRQGINPQSADWSARYNTEVESLRAGAISGTRK